MLVWLLKYAKLRTGLVVDLDEVVVIVVGAEHERDDADVEDDENDHGQNMKLQMHVQKKMIVSDNMSDNTSDMMSETVDTNAFMQKFSNNCVSDSDLRSLAESEMANELMKLPPKMIWIANILTMSDEDFSLLRFMFRDEVEFMELITLGSMNELRQALGTYKARASLQVAMMTDDELLVASPHPGVHLMEPWNPSSGLLANLKALLIARVRTYIETIAGMDMLMDEVESRTSRCETNSCEDSCTHMLLVVNGFHSRTVGRSGIKHTSWQPKMGKA